jgi:hypothetical protein
LVVFHEICWRGIPAKNFVTLGPLFNFTAIWR